jgi:ABC-type branched-subunit amino acid transport system substrate-binding protein
MKFRTLLAAASMAALAAAAQAEGVKVGMITTLSGGGAGLGIDVRDGFLLAVKQSGRSDIEVVIEDDQQKPEIAVQLADKMVQAEQVDVLTGIIWSNLAMAVVPSVTAQGKIYLSPNAGPHMVRITKAVRRFLQACPYRRVEMTVDLDFEAGHRWANMLGFRLEAGRMLAYRPDGGTCSLYARVRQ